jgi:cyclase
MYLPRIIPVLLLKDKGLVKSINFKNHRYIGDPINAVKIFNDSFADELTFLDISASGNKTINYAVIQNIAEEANMPFSYGGGIDSLMQIEKLVKIGVEKVVLGSIACQNAAFVGDAAKEFGSSTVCVCVDIKKNFWGKYTVVHSNALKSGSLNYLDFVKQMEDVGAGELIIQDVNLDGTQEGYNLNLLDQISKVTTIPIVALGGAGNFEHLKILNDSTVVNGLAAGSLFIYHGSRNGILINYPTIQEKFNILSNEDM